jgi:transcriptional regulator with XRE-family HTH domain
MEQNKIGMFIKECRKGKNLTQQELADRLMVSFKTISKWECGKGMPDCSLMLPLCDELGITVNELLSASHLEDSDYKHKAEFHHLPPPY